jgi:hypothetical protein
MCGPPHIGARAAAGCIECFGYALILAHYKRMATVDDGGGRRGELSPARSLVSIIPRPFRGLFVRHRRPVRALQDGEPAAAARHRHAVEKRIASAVGKRRGSDILLRFAISSGTACATSRGKDVDYVVDFHARHLHRGCGSPLPELEAGQAAQAGEEQRATSSGPLTRMLLRGNARCASRLFGGDGSCAVRHH